MGALAEVSVNNHTGRWLDCLPDRVGPGNCRAFILLNRVDSLESRESW